MAVEIVDRPPGTTWQWIQSQVNALHIEHPLRPVTVIAQNYAKERMLRWRFATQGNINVHVTTLSRVALGFLELLDVDQHPRASVLDQWLLLDHLIAPTENNDMLNGIPRFSAVAEVVRLFHESATRLSTDIGIEDETIRDLLIRFQEGWEGSQLIDMHDVFATICGLPEQMLSPILEARYGAWFVSELPTDPWMRQFLEGVGRSTQVTVVRSTSLSGVTTRSTSNEENVVQVELLRCSETVAETTAVIARLLEGALPLHELGIAYVDVPLYQQLVCDLLDDRSIPWDCVEGIPLTMTLGIRQLVELFRITELSFPWEDTLQWLQTLLSSPCPPHMLEQLLWEHGAHAGLTQMAKAAERAHKEDPSAVTLELTVLLHDVLQYPSVINPTPASSERWLYDVIGVYTNVIAPRVPAPLRRCAQSVEDVFSQSLGSLQRQPEVSVHVFQQMFVAQLTLTPQSRPYRGGVNIGSLEQFVGLPLQKLAVIGAIEGKIPARYVMHGVERTPAVALEQRVQFEHQQDEMRNAIEAQTPHLILSYPQWDTHGRVIHPAEWFRDWEQQIAEEDVHEVDHIGQGMTLTIVKDALHVLDPRDPSLSVAEHETGVYIHEWLSGAHERFRRLQADPRHPVTRAQLMNRARYARRIGPYDGNLSRERSLMDGYWQELFDIAPVSSTQLQEWATCPLRYFYHRVLHVPFTDPYGLEEQWGVSPAHAGTLLHAILEDYYRRASGVVGENDVATATKRLRSVVQDVFTREAHALIPLPAVRSAESDRLFWLALRVILNEVSEAELQFMPTYFEQSFGYKDKGSWEELAIPVAGTLPLRIRGKIDRIDIARAGPVIEGIRVIDYKSGKAQVYKDVLVDPLGGGEHLQAALYATAVFSHMTRHESLEPNVVIEAQYWFVGEQDYGTITGFPFTNDVATKTRDMLSTIATQIHHGAFPAIPGEDTQRGLAHCAQCPYDAVCPVQRDRMYEMKRDDPLVHNLSASTGATNG